MRHKHGHGHASSGVNLGLIVTPMLDMSFQLLAFFIMVYHPSALERHIDGNLLPPSETARSAKNATQTDLPTLDEEPQLEDALLVKVLSVAPLQSEGVGDDGSPRQDGDPSRIMLKRKENPDATIFAGSDRPFAEDLKKLTAELKKEAGPKVNIKIEGDGNLKHQYLMLVYDACKQAGYQNIAFVAPAVERAREK
jgi:biopolymer transport protein ExbD